MPYEELPGHDYKFLYRSRDRNDQTRPFINPLPYELYESYYKEVFTKGFELGYTWKNPGDVNDTNPKTWGDYVIGEIKETNAYASTHNKALNKLDDQLTVASNLFESWYERKQAYDLLLKAGGEILDFLKNWRKPKYWKQLGKKVKEPSSLPEAWLTYNFGVKPLIGSIDTAFNNLAAPLEDYAFKGESRQKVSGKLKRFNSTFYYTGEVRVKIGCRVGPNFNPNAALANVAGLTQPFSTVMSVLPWGWAVDYFVNASQLLSNIEVKHPGVHHYAYYTTTSYNVKYNMDSYYEDYGGNYAHGIGRAFQLKRTLTGAPNYKLEFKFPLLGSNQAANLFSAIALTMKGKSS